MNNFEINSESHANTYERRDKRQYKHVEFWKRKAIIDCVHDKSETMKQCAKRIGVNYSTAKHIIKIYRKTGSIETNMMKKRHTNQPKKTKTPKSFVSSHTLPIPQLNGSPGNSISSVPAFS